MGALDRLGRRSLIWWLLPAALFIAVIGVSGLQRTDKLWDLNSYSLDIVRLTADGSASQKGEAPPGALRGFVAVVNARTENDLPITVLLRIRESGGTREILREAAVHIESDGYVEITTGLLSPLVLGWGTPVEYEIQLYANSPGTVSIVGDIRENHPASQLTINGAPTLPELRASVAPVATIRTVSLLRAFGSWNLPLTLAYGGANVLLCLVGFALFRRTLSPATGRIGRPPPILPLLGSAIPATGIVLAVSTATFNHSSGRYYMLEMSDGFWASVFAYLLLWVIGVIALGGLMAWLRRARAGHSGWTAAIRQAPSWRASAKFGIAALALSIPAVLLRLEDVVQVLAGAAVVIIIVAILWRGVASIRSE